MNISRLKKTAVKEFKRSPAKSIALIMLLPVAGYFCAPLFKGFLPKSKKALPVASHDLTASPFTLPVPTTDTSNPTETTNQVDWREVAKWLATDPLAAPATLAAGVRSPFTDPTRPDLDEEAEEEAEDEEAESETPPPGVHDIFKEQLLTLTTTMIGSRRRMAMINGEVFTEGDIVSVSIEDARQQDPFELTLLKVERRTIVLAHEGEQFRLDLPGQIPPDAIERRTASN